MKVNKSPTIKIQQNKGHVSVKLMAFYPNLRSGKNCGFAIVPNDGSILTNEKSIHTDETGQYLYINELALPLSARVSLHKQTRDRNDKPLIFDERAVQVRFVWQ
jgi:hypothetical protein